jgi:hypothetical protein
MNNNYFRQKASKSQKFCLLLLLSGLFLFGTAAEQPAESDCCQGPECLITIYPVRLENIGFNETRYVSLQMSCDVDSVEYSAKGGPGLIASINGDSVQVTTQDISSLEDSKKIKFFTFHAQTRAVSLTGMAHYTLHTFFKQNVQWEMDQVLFDTGSFVTVTASYKIYGKNHISQRVIPVSFNIEELEALFDKNYPEPPN